MTMMKSEKYLLQSICFKETKMYPTMHKKRRLFKPPFFLFTKNTNYYKQPISIGSRPGIPTNNFCDSMNYISNYFHPHPLY